MTVTSQHRAGWTFALAGTLAGAVSAVVFAWVHDVLISDIWFFIVPMLLAGALSGLCLSATFATLVDRPTLRCWAGYNATHVGLLAALGVVSLLAYEPVTTIEELMLLDEPPDFLFAQAMPLIVAGGCRTARGTRGALRVRRRKRPPGRPAR